MSESSSSIHVDTKTEKDNIDLSEKQKFAKLADDWWDLSGPMRPLHQLNPLRLDFVRSHVDLLAQSVLDVGCGGGILAESLAHCQAEVTAIDINESLITVAKQHASRSAEDSGTTLAIDYQTVDIAQLLKREKRYAVVTCMELLEHVPDPALFVKQCAQLLVPGGKVFFSTLNRNLKSFLGAIVAAEYILGMLPRGTHDYQQFIKPSELTRWAEQLDLTLVDLQGLNFKPLTGEFELCRDVSINYLACFQKTV